MSYRAYPTSLFSTPILDHLNGVTHVILSGDPIEVPIMQGWLTTRLGVRSPKMFKLP